MVMFCTDLDNTLIYSYKHDIGAHKICAEIYQGREVSFLTERTGKLLHEVARSVLFVPVTTRMVEQYGRIDLGIGRIPYALVCNGGVLLEDGKEDQGWYRESLDRISGSMRELEKAAGILEGDAARCMEVRNVRGLFLFTKSNAPAESAARLRQALDGSLVDVCRQGVKVYAVPKELTKGNAVMRLKDRLAVRGDTGVKAGDAASKEAGVRVIAAGDSGFDSSMLRCADVGIAPAGLDVGDAEGELVRIGAEALFTEGMLACVAERVCSLRGNGCVV